MSKKLLKYLATSGTSSTVTQRVSMLQARYNFLKYSRLIDKKKYHYVWHTFTADLVSDLECMPSCMDVLAN